MICPSCVNKWQKMDISKMIIDTCFARRLTHHEPKEKVSISIPRSNGEVSHGTITRIQINTDTGILYITVIFMDNSMPVTKTMKAKCYLALTENAKLNSYLKQIIIDNPILIDNDRTALLAQFTDH